MTKAERELQWVLKDTERLLRLMYPELRIRSALFLRSQDDLNPPHQSDK